MLKKYKSDKEKRKKLGIDPLALDAEQVKKLSELLIDSKKEDTFLLDLITNRVPPGVDTAAKVKAEFLTKIAKKDNKSKTIDKEKAVFLLGTMLGGYNINPLIDLLDDNELASDAACALSKNLLVFDGFLKVFNKSKTNKYAEQVIKSWANAEWFTQKPSVPDEIVVTVFKVDGEINTDDLSPASEAWSRPDIPLHALSMLIKRAPNALHSIAELKKDNQPVAFAGDVVGTGSSRKSATNSLLWHIGKDIKFVPNKKCSGIVLGGKIAPIFFNTLEDAGALPIECDVTNILNGEKLIIYPYKGEIRNYKTGTLVSEFELKSKVLLDEVRAGGRINLIIGKSLAQKAQKALNLNKIDIFYTPQKENSGKGGFTLAQKIVGVACGQKGIRPGEYCEPVITTVGSQDTTGPMTRDELIELACLDFKADLVMQSFCHTCAYPKPVDINIHKTLPDFFTSRKGIALKPGDGVIHSWLNRMALPDTVGTGGDSHTRLPLGISFPAGSGLVAFAAAMGRMPLDMPESVHVKFKGTLNRGITMRDVINFIPYIAIQEGMLTVEKKGKKNIFSGKIIEFSGMEDLSVNEAFELSNASAERSAAAAVISLNEKSVIKFILSNIEILNKLILKGYGCAETIKRRIERMENWVDNPVLIKKDTDAKYFAEIEINLADITEPVLACPNDPDNVKLLSEVSGQKIDEVFIGSCMTHVDHFKKIGKLLNESSHLPVKLWITPPTVIDQDILKKEGFYRIFEKAGARVEMPGCSLCMGNQARVADNAVVVSTSTRNFPDRMGDNTDVYLASAEVAVISAMCGEIPDYKTYKKYMKE